jgi:diaminopimelate epimerase
MFLTVGVPHCVLYLSNYDALDEDLKFAIGEELSHDYSRFPEGSNVTFAQLEGEDTIRAVTYERGVEDLTESCGTGCVAAAIAMTPLYLGKTLSKSVEPKRGPDSVAFQVYNPGGINQVRLAFSPDNTSCHAWLKGKAALVAEGRILEDALREDSESEYMTTGGADLL